jgi:rhodanese-related sulfurtransferase
MAAGTPHQEPFQRLSPQQAQELLAKGGVQFIDVREPHEYAEGHAAGAQLMPLNTILTNPAQLSGDQPVVFICKVGQRSALAAEMAAATGHTNLYNVEGGTDAWKDAGLPMEG